MSITQGLFQFGGNLYAAWKGEVGDERLFYASFNGESWTPGAVHIPGNSSIGPSLASPNPSSLFAIWKGENGDGDQRIFYSIFNGTQWSPQVQIPNVATSVGPSLGVLNGVLYAAWKGEEGDNQIYWSQWNGSAWTGQQPIPGATSIVGPSLAGYNGSLYAGFIGVGNQTLQFLQLSGGTWQTAPSIPGHAGSSIGASLAALGESLYAVWVGENSDQNIYYAVLSNGAWSGQKQIPHVRSSLGPALAAYGLEIYAMWVGPGDDQSLYYASFNGAWSGQNTLPGNTGQDYVPPPFAGLTSNSNYLIGSGNCVNLLNPAITITITDDLVVNPGMVNFGFQLNCYSPKNALVAWQQYLIVPQMQAQTVTCGYQGYTNGKGQLFNGSPSKSLGTPTNLTIPANWVLTMQLICDSGGNIVEADFTVADSSASPPWSHSYPLKMYNLTLDAGGPVTITDLAPIVAMQLNIVGPAGSTSKAVFKSGAGTITYSAKSQLTALRAVPTCAEITNPTAEVSDSYYTVMQAGATGNLTQNFGVHTG